MRNLRVSAVAVKAAILGIAISAVSTLASGQGFLGMKPPEVNIFAGYSLVRYDAVPLGFSDKLNMNGGNLEVSLPDLYQGWGIVGDFSGHKNDEMKMFNYTVGPQYRFELKGVDIFGHLLLGKSRSRLLKVGSSIIEPSSLGFMVALGGGADIPIGNRFAIRAIQYDYMINSAFQDHLHDMRFSSGLVIKFGKKSSPPSF
ncbi:MAG TPA: hypothetical protein VN682_21735 [Terriglobales bacterium]|jgi:hypothetical protein|nr:hypothetical protein [Terriglobales bacterium]